MEALRKYRAYIFRVAFFLGSLVVVLFMIGVLPPSFGEAPTSPQTPAAQQPSPAAQDAVTATPEGAAMPAALATETPPGPSATPTHTPQPAREPVVALPSPSGQQSPYLYAAVRTEGTAHEIEVGFYEASSQARQYAFLFRNGVAYALDGGSPSRDPDAEVGGATRLGSIEPGTDYLALVHVQEPQVGGAHFYLSGGGYGQIGQTWTLVWRSDYVAAADLEPLVTVQASPASVQILSSGSLPPVRPAVLDVFDSEGPGPVPLAGRAPTEGLAASTWETPDNPDAWVVANGAATANQTRQTAVIDTGFSDGLVSAQLDPWRISGIIVRYVDSRNWIGIRRRGTDNSVIVVRRENGSPTQIADAPVPTDIDLGGRLDVFMNGPQVRVYVNGFLVHDLVEPFNQAATKHGLWSFGETTQFRDFSVWPVLVRFDLD